MAAELKPCPFCGGKASISWKGNVHSTRKVIIKCGGCRYQRTDAALRHGDEWLLDVAVTAWNTRFAERPTSVPYDRELIAQILDVPRAYTNECRQEQARLLREADNADAARVHTSTQPPAVGVDVSEAVPSLPALPKPWGTDYDDIDNEEVETFTATQMKAYARAAIAALRTGGGAG